MQFYYEDGNSIFVNSHGKILFSNYVESGKKSADYPVPFADYCVHPLF